MTAAWRLGDTRALLAGLVALLVLATLGEGGASAESLLAWHGLLVGLLLWVLLGPRPESARPGRPAIAPTLPGVLFLLLAAGGAVLVPYGYAAWLTCIELAVFLAVFWLAARLGPDLVAMIRWPLGLAALAQMALVLWQRFAGGATRPAGSFLNTNHLAAWMVMVFLLLASAIGAAKSRRARIAAGVLALAPLLAVLLAGSRGALGGLVIGGAWLLLVRWRGLPRSIKPVLIVAAAILVVLVGWRLVLRLGEADPFRYQRVKIWKASASLFLEDPWRGSGPGQFAVAAKQAQFPDGEGPLRYDRRFTVTHSDPLRALAEFGAPAALTLFAALGLAAASVAARRRRGLLRARHDGAVAALIAVAGQSLVDNPSRWPAVYLLVAVLLGALLSSPGRRAELPAAATRRVAQRSALALLLVLVFIVGDVVPTLAHRLVSSLPADADARTRRAVLDAAITLNRVHPGYRMRRAEARLDAAGEPDLNEYVDAREDAEAAVRLQPADSDHRWALARVEARACIDLFRDEATRERARRRFEDAQRLYPTDPRISIDGGEFLLSTGDAVAARRLAERALRVEPEAVPARLLLAEALLEIGEAGAMERAAALVREAREIEERSTATMQQGVYQRELLSADPRALLRLDRRLTEAKAAAGAGSSN